MEWLTVLIHGVIALLFGVVREIYSARSGNTKAIIIITNGVTSAFVGMCVFFLCMSLELNNYLIAFLTSVAGWLGGSLMDFFGAIVKKIIETKTDKI